MRARAIALLVLASVVSSPLMTAKAEETTPPRAWNVMLSSATRFASCRTPGWSHNTLFYVSWRQGGAEIERDCFWGEEGKCLLKEGTDRELVRTMCATLRDAEAADAWLQRWAREDPSDAPYASYFAAALLKPNIDAAYGRGQQALAEARLDLAPESVLAYLGAVGRMVREERGEDVTGWSFEDLLGWLVLYRPDWGKEVANFAALVASGPIPYRETRRR